MSHARPVVTRDPWKGGGEDRRIVRPLDVLKELVRICPEHTEEAPTFSGTRPAPRAPTTTTISIVQILGSGRVRARRRHRLQRSANCQLVSTARSILFGPTAPCYPACDARDVVRRVGPRRHPHSLSPSRASSRLKESLTGIWMSRYDVFLYRFHNLLRKPSPF